MLERHTSDISLLFTMADAEALKKSFLIASATGVSVSTVITVTPIIYFSHMEDSEPEG